MFYLPLPINDIARSKTAAFKRALLAFAYEGTRFDLVRDLACPLGHGQ